MRSVVVAGHICIDLVPGLTAAPNVEPGRLVEVGPLAIVPGGCVSNTGLALVGLGVPTRLAARVGADELGATLVSLLERRGADAAGIERREGGMTSYSIVVEAPDRDRTFWHHVGANDAFDGTGVDLGGAAVLHAGYVTHLSGLLADDAARLRELLTRAMAAGVTTSVDLAEVDPRSAAARLPWFRLLPEILPDVDVATPSVDDLRSILPGLDLTPRAWAELLVEWGVAIAVVTAGPARLALRTGSAERLGRAGRSLAMLGDAWVDRCLDASPLEVAVRSSTGAGDSASAGFLAGIVRGDAPETALRLAVATAAARISGAPFADAFDLAGGVRVEPAAPERPPLPR